MPRSSKLIQLQPNKVYSIQGTVRYKHLSQGFTTLIIQQEEIQKKLKIPQTQIQVQQGRGYKFSNCFYNSQGWLSVRKPNESIAPLQVQEESQLSSIKSLKEIKENLQTLQEKYLSTYLKVISIQPDQIINKNDKQIHLRILRGYSENYLIDITIWNQQISNQQLLNQWVLLEGVRIKKMTQDKFILVSTVFTKFSSWVGESEDDFDEEKNMEYENLSEIYERRNLQILKNMQIPEKKIFSIIKSKVKSIVKAEYLGCPKCKRKIDKICLSCNINTESTYNYGKVILQDENASIEVIIFDEKICELFKFARQNCVIECKVKTFSRLEQGELVISHILTKIDSIFF